MLEHNLSRFPGMGFLFQGPPALIIPQPNLMLHVKKAVPLIKPEYLGKWPKNPQLKKLSKKY